MRYRKLTETGDYTFGGNIKDFYEGTDAICQAIKTKIMLFYGEWWEDLGNGIPMFQSILGQKNSAELSKALESLVVQRVKEVPQVVSVSNIESEVNRRNCHVKLVVDLETESGVEVEVEI